MPISANCPFYAGSTIQDPRLFVGREEALKTLCNSLLGVQSNSINVVGMHRTGKSSLLLQFVNTYQERIPQPEKFVVVYVSLQDAACHNQARFFHRVVKALDANLAAPSSDLPQLIAQTEWDQEKFNQLMQLLKQEGLLPVLCLDNFEELLERKEQFPNGFYDNLRYLASNDFLMLVMASCELLDVYSKRKQITSDFFNVFQMISLNGGLTQAEAEELVRLTNFQGEGLSEVLQAKALEWGKREPYLLQLARQVLWRIQTEQKQLSWAEKMFKQQQKHFNFCPKSPFLASLYNAVKQLGEWVRANASKSQNFYPTWISGFPENFKVIAKILRQSAFQKFDAFTLGNGSSGSTIIGKICRIF